MDMIGRIRRLHVRDKLSEREIARMTGLSRNTVSKWLRAPVAEAPKYRRETRPNKLSAFEAALKQALTADARRAKHERRLAERCRALWSEVRHPEHSQFSVAEMLEHERPHLMPMPEPFDG
ncbi:helix-turn-helix transcriptional regulator, partial [Acidovorax sp. ACV01]